MTQELLSVEEAGRRLGVSRATVYRLLQRGSLKSVRDHGRRRIPASAVRRPRSRVDPRLANLPPFTFDNPMFELLGKYSSGGTGPGSGDKHAILGQPHWK